MDSLSKTLRVLFHETDTAWVIDQYLHSISKPIFQEVTKENFVEALQRICGDFTIDQDIHLYDVLKTKWMKCKKDTSLCYSNSNTIFNALLHYGEDVLIIHNGSPICHFKKLLRFHELTSLIQEDTITCAYYASWSIKNNAKVKDFSWPIHIRHDFLELNDLLKRNLSDIHFHLKGSSANFDLNWLCLMNNVSSLNNELNELGEGFNRLAMIAASIRLYLFSKFSSPNNTIINHEELLFIIRYENIDEITTLIESRIAMVLPRSYRNDYFYDYVDYALTTYEDGINLSHPKCPESIFAGERWLLFSTFKDIYGSNQNEHSRSLLYIYLLIKNKFYQILVQTNNAIGFENFNRYEKLKELFTDKKGIYKALVPVVAIGTFIGNNEAKRYVEARIAPKDTYDNLCKAIEGLYDKTANKSWGWEIEKWKYDIILHFIKEPEKDELIQGQERHFHLRDKVRNQTTIILQYMEKPKTSSSNLQGGLIGIDVANSELAARPEFFAQAFRCLRNHCFEDNKNLCMTFHVGEDFHDLVDGLRAIDEVLTYMEFNDGDRLGHALSLGTDVRSYYKNRQYALAIPKQVLLDNLVWMYVKLKQLNSNSRLLSFIEGLFGNYFADIYGDNTSSKYSIYDYYQSWLLRGDSPNCYSENDLNKTVIESVEPWQASAFCGDKEVRKARRSRKAIKLNFLYQFDLDVRRNGWDSDLFEIKDEWQNEWIVAVMLIQKYLVESVRQRGIHIECNPTSNFKIGEISQYIEHPIFKFHGVNSPGYGLSVSVNTDDSGVFSTSLEREYSLLARAYLKKYEKISINAKSDVLNWMECLRKEGNKACFNKVLSEDNEIIYIPVKKEQQKPKHWFNRLGVFQMLINKTTFICKRIKK